MCAGRILAVIGYEPFERQVDFADQDALGISIEHAPHLLDDVMDFRLIGRIKLKETFDLRTPLLIGGVRRVIPELSVLDQVPHDVNAKTVDAAIEPEAKGGVHRFANVAIAPVQIRLLLEECVIVILLGRCVECPSAAAEIRNPIVGRRSVRPWIAPDVPVSFASGAGASALDEPRMLIGSMVRNEIEDDFQAEPMRLFDQSVELRQRSKDRRDAAIIGDVVAEIRHRRGIDRRYPDRVDAYPMKVVEPAPNSIEVSDAVVVRILKRTRI